MTDETTNPSAESEFQTTEQAAQAFARLLNPQNSSSEQSVEQKQEESKDVEAAPSDSNVEAASEEQTEATETQAAEEPTGEKIVLDGEEIEVSTLKEWKASGLRQADYTKKTQAIAEERKAWEAQKASEEAAFRKEWLDKLASVSGVVADELQEYTKLDWDALKQDDPFQYALKMADYQRAQAKANNVARMNQAEIEAEQKKGAEQQKKFLEEQAQLVKKLIPEFADPTKSATLVTEMTSYLKNTGFSPEEIAGIQDARALKIIKDAISFRKLAENKSDVAQKKVVQQTKVLKPGASQSKSIKVDQADKARNAQWGKLKQTGKVSDAATLMKAFI